MIMFIKLAVIPHKYHVLWYESSNLFLYPDPEEGQ